MKTMKLVSLLILAFGAVAQADQGTINDLPNVVLSCQETKAGAPVVDGKELTLSRDQFGQNYLTVIQPSAFAPLVENLLVFPVNCGFMSCEAYEPQDGSMQIYIALPDEKAPHGWLTGTLNPEFSLEFTCQK